MSAIMSNPLLPTCIFICKLVFIMNIPILITCTRPYIRVFCMFYFTILDNRQQLNEITHFIDASNVYGSTASELSVLRDGTTGYICVIL